MRYLAVLAVGVYVGLASFRLALGTSGLVWLAVPAREVVAGLALLVLSTVVHELGHVLGRRLTCSPPVQKVMVGSHNGGYGREL